MAARQVILTGALSAAVLALAILPAAAACDYATPSDAKALAEQAAAHLKRAGPERAFRDFMDPARGFIDRDLYVFVIDLNGVLWASGAYPRSIGTDARNARDSRGRYFVRDMIRLAKDRQKGWVEYVMRHPCTGEPAPKVSYVIRVGGFIVGVGAYGSIEA